MMEMPSRHLRVNAVFKCNYGVASTSNFAQ